MRAVFRHILFVSAMASAFLSVFFLWLLYELFWKYRHLFDERGRYFEEIESVVYDQDSAVLGAIGSGCVLITCLLLSLPMAWSQEIGLARDDGPIGYAPATLEPQPT